MQGDALSEEAQLRLRASLGLAVVTAAGATATAAAAKGAVASSSAKGIAGAVVAKWMGIVAISAVAIGAAGALATTFNADGRAPISLTQRASAPVTSAPLVPLTTLAPLVPPTPIAPASHAPPPAPASEATPAARPAEPEEAPPLPYSAAPARSRAAPETATPPPDAQGADVGEELRLLEVARQALRSVDAPGAMTALERYRESAPHGVLAVEADALEVEALVASGRRTEAATVGRRFLARNGEGPLSHRVRHLITTEPR